MRRRACALLVLALLALVATGLPFLI